MSGYLSQFDLYLACFASVTTGLFSSGKVPLTAQFTMNFDEIMKNVLVRNQDLCFFHFKSAATCLTQVGQINDDIEFSLLYQTHFGHI